MSHARTSTVTALLLRSRDYGEAHSWFSLLTREEGKVLALAKGVRKPRAKLAPVLQHFALVEIELTRSTRYAVITQARLMEPFYGLRTDLVAFAYANYFAELLEVSVEEHQQHPALFDLLYGAFTRLGSGVEPEMLARYMEISLIAQLGYLPHFFECAQCRGALAAQDADGHALWPTWLGFSAQQGGVVCPRCLPSVADAHRVAAGTVQVAQLLLTQGLPAVEGRPLSLRLRREIEQTFQDYLEYRLERRLQSLRYLHQWTRTANGTPDETGGMRPTELM